MSWLTDMFKGGWNSIVGTLLSGIESAINTAVRAVVMAIQQGITATTTPHLRGSPWFGPLFHSVAEPAFVISMVVLMCALADAVLHGQPGEALKRAFAAPLLVAVAMLAVTTVGGAAVGMVNAMSGTILRTALGSNHAARDAVAALVTAVISTRAAPILAIALGVITLLAVLALWVEMAIRAVLIYLAFALVPLSLAGVFWSRTQSWVRRIVEIIVALLLSQLIIYTVIALGVDAMSSLHAGYSAIPIALGSLVMSAFGLGIALRIAPHTVASAEHFGKAIGHIKQAATMAATTAASTGAAVATGGAALPVGAAAAAGNATTIGGLGATSGGIVEGASGIGQHAGAASGAGLASGDITGPVARAPVPGNTMVEGTRAHSERDGASNASMQAPPETGPDISNSSGPTPATGAKTTPRVLDPSASKPRGRSIGVSMKAVRTRAKAAATAGVLATARTGHISSGVAVGAVMLARKPAPVPGSPKSPEDRNPVTTRELSLTEEPTPPPPPPPTPPPPLNPSLAGLQALDKAMGDLPAAPSDMTDDPQCS
ncbi:MAG: TrbL/VirB6 family protein [Acidimicrobiales bacterium]